MGISEAVGFLRKCMHTVGKHTLTVIRYLVPFMAYGIGAIYTVIMLANTSNDTTAISNTAFAMAATLAAVSFGYTRALAPDTQDRKDTLHAGESFFLSALVLLSASILKYGVLRLMEYGGWLTVLGFVLGLMSSSAFFIALIAAGEGLDALSEVLSRRFYVKHV
jgi:hypothetical protein